MEGHHLAPPPPYSIRNTCEGLTVRGRGPQCRRLALPNTAFCWNHSISKVLLPDNPSADQNALSHESHREIFMMNLDWDIRHHPMTLDLSFCSPLPAGSSISLKFIERWGSCYEQNIDGPSALEICQAIYKYYSGIDSDGCFFFDGLRRLDSSDIYTVLITDRRERLTGLRWNMSLRPADLGLPESALRRIIFTGRVEIYVSGYFLHFTNPQLWDIISGVYQHYRGGAEATSWQGLESESFAFWKLKGGTLNSMRMPITEGASGALLHHPAAGAQSVGSPLVEPNWGFFMINLNWDIRLDPKTLDLRLCSPLPRGSSTTLKFLGKRGSCSKYKKINRLSALKICQAIYEYYSVEDADCSFLFDGLERLDSSNVYTVLITRRRRRLTGLVWDISRHDEPDLSNSALQRVIFTGEVKIGISTNGHIYSIILTNPRLCNIISDIRRLYKAMSKNWGEVTHWEGLECETFNFWNLKIGTADNFRKTVYWDLSDPWKELHDISPRHPDFVNMPMYHGRMVIEAKFDQLSDDESDDNEDDEDRVLTLTLDSPSVSTFFQGIYEGYKDSWMAYILTDWYYGGLVLREGKSGTFSLNLTK